MFFFGLQLDDTILKTIETAPDEELKESRNLILRIRRRDLYQVLSNPHSIFSHYVYHMMHLKRKSHCPSIIPNQT